MKRGTPRHPKTTALARELGIEQYSAIGILEALWHFTGEYAPQGDIGRFSDADIAEAVYWTGSPEVLVSALVKRRWLDAVNGPDRLLVHDWSQHADDAVRKKLSRASLSFSVASDFVETPADFVETPAASRGEGLGKASLVLDSSTVPNPTRARVIDVVPISHAVVDEQFQTAMGMWLSLGVEMSETDTRKCAALWVSLELAEQIAAARDIGERYRDWRTRATRHVPRPWNYLQERQWERKAMAPARASPMRDGDISHDRAAARFLAGRKT